MPSKKPFQDLELCIFQAPTSSSSGKGTPSIFERPRMEVPASPDGGLVGFVFLFTGEPDLCGLVTFHLRSFALESL